MSVCQFRLLSHHFDLRLTKVFFVFYDGNGLPYSSGDGSGKKGKLCRRVPDRLHQRDVSDRQPRSPLTLSHLQSDRWPGLSVFTGGSQSYGVFTSVEENSPFCLNRPLSGHQYSYKCPTMSCTQQKKDYWNQCLHDGILECSGIIYIYIYEYRQTNALGTWGLVFRCRLCADVFCNTDKR